MLKVTETQFQQTIIELAQTLGYKVAHFRPAQTEKGWRTPVSADGKGFPDLVLVRLGRLIFAELKSEKGKVAPEQADWLEKLAAAGGECYVWRPGDYDKIETLLKM